jgi:large subunit ribosomal protein L25
MSDTFVIEAEIRSDLGKGSSRRLRRLHGKVPAILYGGGVDPVALTLSRKDLTKSLENEAFYSQILTIQVEDKQQKAVLKDLQRHPAKETVMHADFLRVSEDVKITVRVPLHFTNEDSCVGVKMEGGVITHSITELEIQCLPADLPEYIEFDMGTVTAGQIIHISDLQLPEGVESVALSHGEDHDLPVASVQQARGGSDDDLDDVDADADADDGEADDADNAADEGESED